MGVHRASILLLTVLCLVQVNAFKVNPEYQHSKPKHNERDHAKTLERVVRNAAVCEIGVADMSDCTLNVASTLHIDQATMMTNVKIICATSEQCIDSAFSLYMDNVQVTSTEGHGSFLYLKGGADLMAIKVIVSGFTAPGGNHENGAVLYVDEPGSNIMIKECTFKDNSVPTYGGALYLKGVNLAMSHTVFTNNHAPAGGGAIAMLEGSGTITETQFTSCTSTQVGAERKKKWNAGGAVYLNQVDLTFTSCTFHKNFASWEGAAMVMYKSSITCRHNTFTENEAEAVAGLAINDCKMVIDNCHFENNRGTEYGGAIGIWFDDSAITMHDNTFKDNFAPEGKGPDFYCEAKDHNYIYVTQTPAISDAQSWDEPYHETLPEGGSCNTNRF